MPVTTSEVAALGIVGTLVAGLASPWVQTRQARHQRRVDWATRAANAYSAARVAWSHVANLNAGIGGALRLVPEGELQTRHELVQEAIAQLRSIAATSEHGGEVPHELAQRLWALDSGMIAAFNVIRLSPDEEKEQRLAPLQAQVQRANDGRPEGVGLPSESLESLFATFEEQVRKSASP